MKAAISLEVSEEARYMLNSFVGWLNMRYPKSDNNRRRQRWNQDTAADTILTCSEYWNEFTAEE